MDIKADSTTLEDIFYGLNKRYFIPKYQRDYSWTSNNELIELWNDIVYSYGESKEYFMGTILLAAHDKKNSYYDIVDGQQRAISFMLLLSVIQDYSKLVVDGRITTAELDCIGDIREDLADSLFSSVNRHIKHDDYYLRANNKDSNFFESALNVSNREILTNIQKSSNRITKAKRFFQEKIKSEFFGRTNSLILLREFFRFLITKLKFVTIIVKDDFDAYVIFESLNSKGMDLSVADLLKNKILSNVKDEYQDVALKDWDDLVKTIQGASANFVDYIKIYWNAYESSEVTKANLYQAIRKKIGSNEEKTRILLSKLVANSEPFTKLKNKNNLSWPKINKPEKWITNVAEMNLLGYTIHLPCFLYAINNNESILDKLSQLSLNLLFRWVTICDYGVGEIDSLFKKLLNDMMNKKTDDEILQNFNSLIDKVDNSFKENFCLYDTESSVILKYIICKIELRMAGKTLIPDYNEVDLEHILPKNTTKWESFGSMGEFSKPYSRWINSIGNVVLLEKSINRKIKDDLFTGKRSFYKESSFITTKNISDFSLWREDDIQSRVIYLSKLADEIWSLN